jgi:hypothetical protein
VAAAPAVGGAGDAGGALEPGWEVREIEGAPRLFIRHPIDRGDPPPCLPGERTWSADYVPSFHRACRIELRVTPGGDGALQATWYTPREVPAPEPFAGRVGKVVAYERGEIRAPLDAKATRTLVGKLDAIDEARLPQPDPRVVVLDGIMVRARVCRADGTEHRFSIQSPGDRHGRHRDFFLALVDASLEAVRDEDGAWALEDLVGYLSGRLLATDLGGTPRLLRLSGWLSVRHQEALGRFFAGVPGGDVVVDARNFAGGGTALGPEFVAFDRRAGRTLWVIEGGRAARLELLGVDGDHIVFTLDEARRRLERTLGAPRR